VQHDDYRPIQRCRRWLDPLVFDLASSPDAQQAAARVQCRAARSRNLNRCTCFATRRMRGPVRATDPRLVSRQKCYSSVHRYLLGGNGFWLDFSNLEHVIEKGAVVHDRSAQLLGVGFAARTAHRDRLRRPVILYDGRMID
jgi:hypothetical protein